MTIQNALSNSGIEKRDAEVLLSHVLGKDRTWLFAHKDDELSKEAEEKLERAIVRRKKHEPVAYITGFKEFFGRSFAVNTHTLIPRPSTELLVEQSLRILSGEGSEGIEAIDNTIVCWTKLRGQVENVRTVIDVGTGSGCIAITLACENPTLEVIATDISEKALELAKKNAERLHAQERIQFFCGSLLEPIEHIDVPFLLVSNPPYIPENESLMLDVLHYEPRSALFSGSDGADIVRKLTQEVLNHPFCRGFVIECREEQVRLTDAIKK